MPTDARKAGVAQRSHSSGSASRIRRSGYGRSVRAVGQGAQEEPLSWSKIWLARPIRRHTRISASWMAGRGRAKKRPRNGRNRGR